MRVTSIRICFRILYPGLIREAEIYLTLDVYRQVICSEVFSGDQLFQYGMNFSHSETLFLHYKGLMMIQLVIQEDFITFSHHERFKPYKI